MRILRTLLVGIVILWGLLALMVRAATPFIADYRDEIAALAAERLGVPVSIGGLTSRWYGLSPLLEFHQVRIGTTAPELMEVERLTVDLAPAELLSGSLVDALRLTVDGLQLTLIREPTGQLHLQGIGALSAAHAERHGPVALPSHIRAVNTRVMWIDRKAGKAPLPIDDVAVLLDRDGSVFKLRAHLYSGAGRAELSARLDGLLTGTAWSGETYLQVSGLNVADLFAHYLPANYGLRSLTLDLESWGYWRDARPVHSQGGIQLRDLDLQPQAEGSAPLQVAEASARYTFAREPDGLRVGIRDLTLAVADHRWPAGDLAFSLSHTADGQRSIRAAADYLRIDDLVGMLQVRLPWPELREPLARLQPAGEVRDLKLAVDGTGEQASWRGQARFTGLTLAPWEKFPGVERLSGKLHGQQDHLVAWLDSRGATLRLGQLFRDPLDLDRLQGRVDLQRREDGWRLSSEELVADSPHIATRSRLMLDWRPQRPLFADLQTDFRDGDAAFASRYYPTGVMSTALVGWLDGAIRSGRVTGGTFLLHGALSDFPFEDSANGVFEVAFDTRDVMLDYRAGWPPLEQVAAQVRFHGNRLDIDLEAARIHDSLVGATHARIPSLHPVAPIEISGRVTGPLADNLRVLQGDALRDRFGHIAAALRGEGQTELSLDIAIPLGKTGKPALDGVLRFDDAQLSLPEWQLAISGISGDLAFTLDGVTAKGIRARALDAPVKVDILRLADGATRVRTLGRFTLDAIRRQLPAIPLPFTRGAADFTVDVDVPPAGAPPGSPSGLSVASDLAGVAVELPAPFGKLPAQTRRLSVYLPISGRDTPGSLGYAGQISARFSADGERVDLVLGGEEARLGTEPGVRIGGRIHRFNVADWQPVLAGLPATDGTDDLPLTVDLKIDRLLADTVTMRRMHIEAARRDRSWQGRVAAHNMAGRFVVPGGQDPAPVQVDLERLTLALPLGSDDAAIPPRPDVAAGPDPTTLPGLRLRIAELSLNDASLGALQLDARAAPDGLHVTELSLRGGQLELESAGHWSREGDGFRTELGGRVSTANLGNLLVALGYSRQVEEAGGGIGFMMRWPGSPVQFHRATLRGEVDLDVGRGRLVELDPGVTRVVGLLNLNALTRRLRLDFSDFYKKGYSFDSIKGMLRFARGTARTENLSVLGPTGRIDLRGEADLMARTLDQKVTVTPNLDATLPIAGTLAGGPVAGIAVLVAQKVMTKQVDRLNRFEYSLTGPWSEPDVKQLDTGGTLSKILQPFQGEDAAPAASDDQPAADQAPAPAAAGPAPEQPAQHPEPPATGEQAAPEDAGALRRLIDIFKQSESHGADLPGIPE